MQDEFHFDLLNVLVSLVLSLPICHYYSTTIVQDLFHFDLLNVLVSLPICHYYYYCAGPVPLGPVECAGVAGAVSALPLP